MLNTLVPFGAMPLGLKLLVAVGGATTARLASDVFPVPASVEVMVTLLSCEPAVVPVTLTDTTHDAPTARLAPDKLTVEDPSAAVAVPSQVLVRLPGVDTTSPAGKLSVNARPFTDKVASVLVMVKLRPVEPFRGIAVAPNAFTMVGGLGGANAATGAGPATTWKTIIKPRMNAKHNITRAAGDMILLVTVTTPFSRTAVSS
jgi:hypothetical protein